MRAPSSLMPLAAPGGTILLGAALRFAPLKRCAESPVCDNTYPRWGGHDTLVSMPTVLPCSAHRLLSYGRGHPTELRASLL
jgi:hypothetical protein